MDNVRRLKAALAMKGVHVSLDHVRTLPQAMIEIARATVGEDGWRFVVGETDFLK